MAEAFRGYRRTAEVAFAWAVGAHPESMGVRLACASVDLSPEEAGSACARVQACGADDGHRVLQGIDGRFLAGLQDVGHLTASMIADALLDAVGKPNEVCRWPRREKLAAALGRHLAGGDLVAAVGELVGGLSLRDPSALRRIFDRLDDEHAFIAQAISYRGEIAERFEGADSQSLIDAATDSGIVFALRAHRDRWGHRHRRIAVTVAKGSATTPIPTLMNRSSVAHAYGPYPCDDCWEAWRQSGPPRHGSADGHAAIELCTAIAAAAIDLHGCTRDADPGSDAAYSRLKLDLHYLGDLPPSSGLSDRYASSQWRMIEPGLERDARFASDADHTDREPDALRVARLLTGSDLVASRDRLMCKMMGQGLGPGALTTMRLDALRVDAVNDLHDRHWRIDAPVYRMDSQDATDLWTLVRASATLEGHLFASVDGAYGAHPLARADINKILDARSTELLADANLQVDA